MNLYLFLLGLLFLGLKLADQIDWSWWVVLLPFYGPFALLWGGLLAGLFFALCLAAIIFAYEKITGRTI